MSTLENSKLRKVLAEERPLIFDGAMGTMLQKSGIAEEKVPELYLFKNPETIKDIHKSYLKAGSDIISTNTFGANYLKVKDCGYRVDEIVREAVKLAREAIEDLDAKEKYVALALGPIGKLMVPTGDLTFEEACDLYREQMVAGLSAGADLILVETLSDPYELKAALVTARELTDIPVFCTMTFQEDGRTLMGQDPFRAIAMVKDLGADGIGVNCSLGPAQMLPIVEEFVKYSPLPVMVQPNAGLPEVRDGETVYNVKPGEFADVMEEMLYMGVSVVGGCCGTGPEHIKELSKRVKAIDDAKWRQAAKERNIPKLTMACSAGKTVVFEDRIVVIGERINPTGKKLLKEALKSGDYDYIEDEAIAQVKAGAEVLDVNVGLPEIDEKEAMLKAMERIAAVVDVPLQIDSANPTVVEAAARLYNGRPIINSVNGKQEVMDAIFPIVKKYGSCVVALTLDEKGLPESAEERVKIAETIIREAEKYGIGPERILVDCLTLTVSAQQKAGVDTLKAIGEVKDRFGVKTTLGASNVSFGLPQRPLLNRTFLAMALYAGLDAPITDPLAEEYMDTIRAYETLAAKDTDSKDFIKYYGGKAGPKTETGPTAGGPDPSQSAASDDLYHIIVNGYQEKSKKATEKLLESKAPLEIVETVIIPALEQVGKEYESGEKFLPQLVQSADAVKPAFEIIKEALSATGENISYGKIILATVLGDIHDIGKNIVKVLLENYGYEVIDLGKDVDIEKLVETAKAEEIQLVGLSALMTTTVVNMEASIKAFKDAGLDLKVAVGGAVLNEEYAKKIGADYYCKDAMDGVKVANQIFRNNKKQ